MPGVSPPLPFGLPPSAVQVHCGCHALACLAHPPTLRCRKRGRVVARVHVQLYDLLDHVLRHAAKFGAPLASSGKPCELVLPFEEEDLGGWAAGLGWAGGMGWCRGCALCGWG